jgi:hypothetical protein
MSSTRSLILISLAASLSLRSQRSSRGPSFLVLREAMVGPLEGTSSSSLLSYCPAGRLIGGSFPNLLILRGAPEDSYSFLSRLAYRLFSRFAHERLSIPSFGFVRAYHGVRRSWPSGGVGRTSVGARRHYNRSFGRSTNIRGLPLEANGTDGWTSGHRLLLLGTTMGCLGTHRGLEA